MSVPCRRAFSHRVNCAMRCGLPPIGCVVVCAKAPVQARHSASVVSIFFISFSGESATVRRQPCAAIRSMTGRIFDDLAGVGNLEIMSPYVAVRFRRWGLRTRCELFAPWRRCLTRATSMPRWIECTQDAQEYGTTMPVVPKTDRPPRMPRR